MDLPRNMVSTGWSGFEEFAEIHQAIAREKHIKKWRRAWKIELIEKTNPDWMDLFAQIV